MFDIERGPREPEEEIPQQEGQAEKIKSPEELRFEELVEQSKHMPLEPDYGPSEYGEPEISDNEAYNRSLRGAFLESGDPEKMAIFRMREAKQNLDHYAATMRVLDNWDERKKDETLWERTKAHVGGWKKEWQQKQDETYKKLKPAMLRMGETTPVDLIEARERRENLMSFEHWQNLVDWYKEKKENKKKKK